MEFSEVHELEHNGMPSFFNGLANIECPFSWMHSICCVAKGTILDECFNLLGTSRQDGQCVLAASDVSDAVYTWVSFQIFVLLVISNSVAKSTLRWRFQHMLVELKLVFAGDTGRLSHIGNNIKQEYLESSLLQCFVRMSGDQKN